MIGWAFSDKKDLYFRFIMSSGSSVEKSKYVLGSSICDFTAVSQSISDKLFQILNHKFITDVSNRIDNPTIGAYVPFLRKALETNPYIFIYLRFYAECLVECCNDRNSVFEKLDGFICTETMEKHKNDVLALVELDDFAKWLRTILCEDMEFRKLRAKKYLDFIISPAASYNKYSVAQRLYILRSEKDNCFSDTFTTKISTLYDFERTATLGTVKTVFLENKDTIIEEYEIDSPDDLISLELFFAVKKSLPIKKCRCCMEYFVPVGRSDSEYCSRINAVTGHRCSGIGAMQSFKKSHENDPIYTEYNKAYKRMHSKYRNNKLYDWEFKDWSKKARTLRDKCKEENRSVEQYKILLKEIEL